MQTSEKVDAIFGALAEFQAEVKDPTKDANNPFFKSKYVTLDNLVSCVRPTLAKHGLCYAQECGGNESVITVSTVLMHKTGQWIKFDPVPLKSAKQDPQGAGSAVTYGRRYSLSAALGIAWCDEDDDGNACSSPTKAKQQTITYEDIRKKAEAKGSDMEKFDKFVHDKYGDVSMLSQQDLRAIEMMVARK